MSKHIAVLSEDIANKIAAGEVVERPASIVKELIENSIDAGATDIRVELEKGGCHSIKVMDNGSGIDYDDVPLVFQRHATSKIHAFEDIFDVASFGFRGEAMPSIASVARVDIQTRPQNDLSGTKATLVSGIIKEIAPVGCPEGTQIVVGDIFANIPARKKFLKTEATEQGACLDVISRLALAHPEIRFNVSVNGKDVFNAPQTPDMSQRIAMVLGHEFFLHSLAVDAWRDNLRLTGYISRPDFTKSNSKNIFLFVNKRFVRDNSITHAVLSAYRQIIEARRYPAAAIFLEIPPRDVDINVHPAKMEVRFRNARDVYDFVSRTIAQNLSVAQTSGSDFIYRLIPKEKTGEAAAVSSVREKPSPIAYGLFSKNNLQNAICEDWAARAEAQKTTFPMTNDPVTPDNAVSFAGMRYVGQYAGTYLIFESRDDLLLLDQHAAHERILLEKMKKNAGEKNVSQTLLMPEIVNLTPGQISLFSDYLVFFHDIGLETEIFGRDAVVVKSVPAILAGVSVREMLSDIADQLDGSQQASTLEAQKEKILINLACKAAIKAGKALSPEEVAALCRELENTPFSMTCPHGRPVTIRIALSDIERMFKRK